MKTTRERYSADSKANVALEAIRGNGPLAQLAAAEHGRTDNQINGGVPSIDLTLRQAA